MATTTFKTNPISLHSLLRDCRDGKIQLPNFQRSWVWEEDRILSLIASVASAFPIGALMTLETKHGSTPFARRPIEGAPEAAKDMKPDELLLDGQQRMTSLYQACLRGEVVETIKITSQTRRVKRWFYFDIQKALGKDANRDDAVLSVPEDRRNKTNFDKDIVLDLSDSQREYEQLMFPVNRVFAWDDWREGFEEHWIAKGQLDKRMIFRKFKDDILKNFESYQVPVISLGHDTSTAAVCVVFEKVNTGGKALDAFELLTAMYAAQDEKLRDYWLGADGKVGLKDRLATHDSAAGQTVGVLSKVASTDVLQAIALRHTKKVRADKAASGVKENELPAVRASRQSLLDLPLHAFREFRDSVENGFKRTAKFLRQQNIHRVIDLPYQSQLVPLAAIFSEIGNKADHAVNVDKIARWFWCGIFGELYGGAIESRFAKDIVEVPAWLEGGPEPSTVKDGVFRADRLLTMRTRLSAAYKGIHALLMREGAKDFRSGQGYDLAVFFDEGVDIHHIFPRDWCEKQNIDAKIYDTVINKTPLFFRTNRIIGGVAPSKYLARLEAGRKNADGQIEEPPIAPDMLDGYLASHCISAQHLRADDFKSFMDDRRKALLTLIANATGHMVTEAVEAPEEGEELSEDLIRDSGLLPASA